MAGIQDIVLAVLLIGLGIAQAAGWLPRWLRWATPRSFPRWAGLIGIIGGLGILAFALAGPRWSGIVTWLVLALVAIVLGGWLILGVRGAKRLRSVAGTEEERLKSFLNEKHRS